MDHALPGSSKTHQIFGPLISPEGVAGLQGFLLDVFGPAIEVRQFLLERVEFHRLGIRHDNPRLGGRLIGQREIDRHEYFG
jgi:predicted component of type VI protein secretion system